jgi:hypothetical protein
MPKEIALSRLPRMRIVVIFMVGCGKKGLSVASCTWPSQLWTAANPATPKTLKRIAPVPEKNPCAHKVFVSRLYSLEPSISPSV